MANPWLKKNPFMSMWLSAANRFAGQLRGEATAQARRNVTAAVSEAVTPPKVKVKARRRPKP